jgi:hypothetical protein
MADIEFRLRRSEDEFEPFYVRIAEAGDGDPLAFTENDESEAAGTAAIDALRAGDIDVDTLHDKGNDVWFFRLKTPDGTVLFRSMPCPSEASLEGTIHRILSQAVDAAIIVDR